MCISKALSVRCGNFSVCVFHKRERNGYECLNAASCCAVHVHACTNVQVKDYVGEMSNRNEGNNKFLIGFPVPPATAMSSALPSTAAVLLHAGCRSKR